MDYKRSLYSVAINGQGYILANVPNSPARQMVQNRIFGTRFASGDRNYADFTFWWYWAQSDWSQGFEDVISWADNAKYYYATNIDAFSQSGSIQLFKNIASNNTFAGNVVCGVDGSVGGVGNTKFVGTAEPKVYRYISSWASISAPTTNISIFSQLFIRNSILWILGIGTEGTVGTIVQTWSGSAFTDQTALIYNDGAGALTWDPINSRCGVTIASTTYVFVDNYTNKSWALVSTTKDNPSAAGDWAKVIEKTSTIEYPISCSEYKGNLYYFVRSATTLELRVYNIAGAADASIAKFKGTVVPTYGVGDSLLRSFSNLLFITVPANEIWTYDGSSLTRVYLKDSVKSGIKSGATPYYEAVGYLNQGCVVSNNKVWWGNLVYENSIFHNWIKEATDDASKLPFIPLFTDLSDVVWGVSNVNYNVLYGMDFSGLNSNYKGSAGKNFLVFNQIDTVSTVDKLFFICNLNFEKLITGQKIIVEYCANDDWDTDPTKWVQLGTVDYSIDGGTIINKTLTFPDNFIYKKLWVRVKLEAGGSDTPVLQDISIAYYPLPPYRERIILSLNCSDNLLLMDGKTKEPKKGEELRNILRAAWKTRQSIEFQDIDFAETALNGALTAVATSITVNSTNNFPEQGIIRIENEKILYTSKTAVAFTGITRGYDYTVPVAHSDATTVSNSLKVVIINYTEQTPIGARVKINEFVSTLDLIEI